MARTKTISSETVYRGRAVSLRVDQIETPSGRRTTREVVEHSDAVAIIAVGASGEILLVRQYRESVGKELLEVPAGGIDAGEDPAAAVRRELQEEAGYRPRQVQPLGGFYSSPGFCTEYLYVYLASDLTPGRLEAEDTESISVIPVAPAEVPGLIASGAICDAKSVAGLLLYLGQLKTAQ